MKKLFYNKSLLLLILLLSVAATSCLKDKGFEDGEYGAVRDTEGGEFITIPRGSRAFNTLGLESRTGSQTINLFAVSYDYVDPAPSDITATLAVNNNLVKAADSTVTVLPATSYSVPSNTVTVAAGKRISNELAISLNTSTLDPTKKYGIGFTLTGVSKEGVAIPANLKNVVYVFTIKNRFDGMYTLRSKMDIPSDRSADWLRTPFTYPYDISLVTTGPLSVEWINPLYGTEGYRPLMAPGASGYGATRPAFVFDEANKLVSVSNVFPNPSNGRAFEINSSVTTSRYDPATKTIYASYIMTQPSFQPITIYDTLTFKSARP